MNTQHVLLKPIVTERANSVSERHNHFSFAVARDANKHQIREAVESIYGVSVEGVRTMMVPGKTKRRGTHIGKRPNWKKAIVSLKKGDTIDFYATE